MITLKHLPGVLFLFLLSLCAHAQMCPPTAGTELITNGNFESCITGVKATDGFGTDYSYKGATTCPGGGGTATIGDWSATTNASLLNGAYVNATGTPGPGNPSPNRYLLIDVDGTVNTDGSAKSVYSTSVNVTNGTTYFFSAWMADINATFYNPPVLKFFINGAQVGATVKVDSNANTNGWQQFYVFWKAPTTGAINISIVNDLLVSSGNDLALDNISFSTSCGYISNLNQIGKTSNLPDTIYACNVSYPYLLNPGVGPAGYHFQWKNSGGTVLGSGSTYSFASAPAAGKYFLCYDTITGCPRTDSVYVSNTLNVNIKPDQLLCPPINYTINPGLTSAGINYQWKLNGTQVANSTAATTWQAIQTGTYSLTVSKAGCGTATSQMVISSPTPVLAGTATCGSGGYVFSATPGTYHAIAGVSSVGWYNTASGGSALNAAGTTTTTVTSAATLVAAPGCPTGGLYAQDLNSFNTTLGPVTNPCPSSISTTGASAGAMLLIVYKTVTLNSLQIVQQNYSTGGTATYAVQINSNSPGSGPYSGGCGCNIDGAGAVIPAATGPTLSFPQTTTPIVRTLTVGPGGAGYSLTGTPAGTKYWITIAGSEFGYLGCGATYPYNNTPNAGVVDLAQQLVYNGVSTSMEAFNLKFTMGTPDPCSRTWVCPAASCPMPVDWVDVHAARSAPGIAQISWTVVNQKNVLHYVVERSYNAVDFMAAGTVSANVGSGLMTYTFSDLPAATDEGYIYYRIREVDTDGKINYSKTVNMIVPAKTVIYPNPFSTGFTVRRSDAQPTDYELVNALGQQVWKSEQAATDIEIKLPFLAAGVYYLKISGAESMEVVKLVKE